MLIKITNKRKGHLKNFDGDPTAKIHAEEQIGRKLEPNDTISIYEFKIVYDWQLGRS